MTCIKALLVTSLLLVSCGSADKDSAIETDSFDHRYISYASVLTEFVKAESVDYLALKNNRTDLDSFIGELAGLTLREYDEMERDEQMAMWINAYNGITLRSIIDAYPVASIEAIDGVWDDKRWKVAGENVTLDDIEHNILRPKYDDPRIHFAINNASAGCPPLMATPFTARRLDKQLESAVANFVNNPARNSINPHDNVVKTTEIFSWFADDFKSEYSTDDYLYLDAAERAVLNFVFSHADSSIFEFVDLSAEWSVEYMPYDWSLNDIER